MAKTKKQKQEEEYRRNKLMEDEVVEFLKKHDSQYDYNILYVRFDPHGTGQIQTVIQEMITYETVELKDGIVKLRSYKKPQDSDQS